LWIRFFEGDWQKKFEEAKRWDEEEVKEGAVVR
jgi:hypothetical protein